MKKILLIATLIGFSISGVQAEENKYEKIMLSSISEIYEAETTAALDALANKFARIGEAEKDKWHPYYYAALSKVFKAFKVSDNLEKDLILDEGAKYVAIGKEIDPKNSELEALDGFINMIKIGVDPETRGQTLSPKIFRAFATAMALDSGNPRAVLFMGQMSMGTAEFFKQPLDESCQLITRANDMFNEQQSKDATDVLAPTWGQYGIDEWLGKCN